MKRQTGGFSLIEIMIALAIVGILTAVAVPSYSKYVLRTRLAEAFTGLAGVQPGAEQYWSNKNTFVGFDRLPTNTGNFTFSLSESSASSYTVTATGAGPATDFIYTIDQSGKRATTKAPAGWTTSTTCWVDRKEGLCAQ